MQGAQLQTMTWKTARHYLEPVNPTLTRIIDALSPGNTYKLYKITYPFGSYILKQGKFHLPNKMGTLVPLNNPDIPSSISQDLSYNIGTNPVSVNLHGSTEIFMLSDHYTIPLYGLIPPGKIISTWHILNRESSQSPAFLWDMTAGARSLFMLPKISYSRAHHRLKKAFQIKVDKPHSLLDHWEIFRALSQHKEFGASWHADILYFSEAWFSSFHDVSWQPFHRYLLDTAWKGSEHFRNQFLWQLIYSLIKKNRNIKVSPHIVDTAEHLLAIATGSMPGFAPATDHSAGPIETLQSIYCTIYGLKDYAPTIMQPMHLAPQAIMPVYYSLNYPSMLKFSPPNSNWVSKIDDLYAVKSLLSKYLDAIARDALNMSCTPIMRTNRQFDFFHYHTKNLTGIYMSEEIPIMDDRFTNKNRPDQKFSSNNTFARSCIRIGKIAD